jgi:DNA-binding XRE family transcriptional regulator
MLGFRCQGNVGFLPCLHALGRASLEPSTKEAPMTKTPILLDPKLLGFWVRCIRKTQNMSQDALAESSNVDIRTIQRMEAGNPVNVTTRRCLARGLGYDNHDIFDDPQFAMNVQSALEGAQAVNCSCLQTSGSVLAHIGGSYSR